jgi:lipid A disaccharide synthetase
MPEQMIVTVVFSLIAILVMVLLIKGTGITRPVLLTDETPVRETINEHFEGENVERIVLSENGNSALAFMQNGQSLLVRALGDRMAVRPLNAQTLKSLQAKDDALVIKLRDFTWPATTLKCADAAVCAQAQTAINSALANDTTKDVAHA